MNKVQIDREYVTLGQLLKMVNIIGSGGEAKFFLLENEVIINGEKDSRRGRKLYPNDHVSIKNYGDFQKLYLQEFHELLFQLRSF